MGIYKLIKLDMSFGMQGGHSGTANAFGGGNIMSNPISYGGGVHIGDVEQGPIVQKPTVTVGPSSMQQSTDLSMPMPGKGGELQNLQGFNLADLLKNVHVSYQPGSSVTSTVI